MESGADDLEPHARSAAEVAAELGVDPERGLTSVEAKVRLERYGPNQLAAKAPVPAWRRVLAQFSNVLVLLLIGAAAVSAVLWALDPQGPLPYEALAILAIVILNGMLGYVQQARAEQALSALRQMSAAHAAVIRDGARRRVLAADLVPGDVILVEEGDTVPADGRLIESVSLRTAEAALTGESLPTSKSVLAVERHAPLGDRRNMVFGGTAAIYGRGRAVVTATGMQTHIGRIAGALRAAPDARTPLQDELDRVGRRLAIGVCLVAAAMIAAILVFAEVRGPAAVFETLFLGVALAVAAVPEGLPAVVTAVLALGVQRMAARRAIIRHLAAVETLGSADVIASDKTGTLTKNEMTVRCVVTASGRVDLGGAGYAPEGEVRRRGDGSLEGPLRAEFVRTLAAADRANNAVLHSREGRWFVLGDPTEGALIVAARKAGLEKEALDVRFERVAEIPFSSERKLMSTIHRDAEADKRLLAFTKGAPDVLLSRCTHELVGEEIRPLTEERRHVIQDSNQQIAAEALRTLGVASRALPGRGLPHDGLDDGLEQEMVFLGLVGMIDPPRQEAAAAVARAQAAGLRVLMITGDHPRTGAVIAAELGITDDRRAVSGVELDRLSEHELDRAVRDVSVYARVDPEHKLRIVKALQRQGFTVAVTGDGVNDAPALKTADIGVAMGVTGTDVAKEAADMVLADDNFASIVAAVEEGRAIFSNIRKFLRYLLSSNIGEVLTMFFGVLAADVLGLVSVEGGGIVLPLLATQILWINLATDGAPALALGVDPPDPDTMNRPPRPRGEGVITRPMWAGIVFVGVVMAAGTLGVLDAALPGGLIEGRGSPAYGQTMAFTTLMLFQLFNVFNARSDERSAFADMFANAWLWAAVGLSLVLQVLVIYTPPLQEAFSTVGLSPGDWIVCALVASSVLWLRELSKALARARHARPTPQAA